MSTFITIDQVKTLIINHKDNLGGLENEQIIEFMNFVNQTLYPEFAAINPNRYLEKRYIKTINGTREYPLPSNFRTDGLKVGNILETTNGDDFGAINFDTETIAFTTIGQTITGSSSGATGTLYAITDYGDNTGTLIMTNVSTDLSFIDNEILTGSSEGSATSNETLFAFSETTNKLLEREFGSREFGYFEDGTNLTLLPTPTDSRVYIMRHLPELAEMTTTTGSTGTTIIPIEYKEYARNVADIYFQQYHGNTSGEADSNARTAQALVDMLKKISITPRLTKSRTRFHSHRSHRHRHNYYC